MIRSYAPSRIAVFLFTAVLCCEASWAPLAAQSRPRTHVEIACAACHVGALSDRGRPHVPGAACLECHVTADLQVVNRDGVRYDHLAHMAADGIAVDCAGCHDHPGGAVDLGLGEKTCALCHRAELEGEAGAKCRTCHAGLPADAATSQGLHVRHGELAWMEGACLRCHYEVSGPSALIGDACAACHDEQRLPEDPGDRPDLHPSHREVACGSCHEVGVHRVRSMSSAVDLNCADCHAGSHGATDARIVQSAALCNGCHRPVHQAQQRLLLGLADADLGETVSGKFLAGLSCRSCHAEEPSGRGTRGSCDDCHVPQYGRITGWWENGAADRVEAVRRYARSARAALSAAGWLGETPGLDQAEQWLALVGEGGAEHNIVLSHRLIRASLARAEAAYRQAGAVSPLPPQLGSEPRAGFCSFCHYDMAFDETEVTLGMADSFHRSLPRFSGR